MRDILFICVAVLSAIAGMSNAEEASAVCKNSNADATNYTLVGICLNDTTVLITITGEATLEELPIKIILGTYAALNITTVIQYRSASTTESPEGSFSGTGTTAGAEPTSVVQTTNTIIDTGETSSTTTLTSTNASMTESSQEPFSRTETTAGVEPTFSTSIIQTTNTIIETGETSAATTFTSTSFSITVSSSSSNTEKETTSTVPDNITTESTSVYPSTTFTSTGNVLTEVSTTIPSKSSTVDQDSTKADMGPSMTTAESTSTYPTTTVAILFLRSTQTEYSTEESATESFSGSGSASSPTEILATTSDSADTTLTTQPAGKTTSSIPTATSNSMLDTTPSTGTSSTTELPPSTPMSPPLSDWEVAGIVLGSLFGVVLIVLVSVFVYRTISSNKHSSYKMEAGASLTMYNISAYKEYEEEAQP